MKLGIFRRKRRPQRQANNGFAFTNQTFRTLLTVLQPYLDWRTLHKGIRFANQAGYRFANEITPTSEIAEAVFLMNHQKDIFEYASMITGGLGFAENKYHSRITQSIAKLQGLLEHHQPLSQILNEINTLIAQSQTSFFPNIRLSFITRLTGDYCQFLLDSMKEYPTLTMESFSIAQSPKLMFISPRIGELIQLQGISISEGCIELLPDNISLLSRLKKLSIEMTQLQTLPANIGHLTALESLDLALNDLRALPPSMQLCPINELCLDFNPKLEKADWLAQRFANLNIESEIGSESEPPKDKPKKFSISKLFKRK